MDPFSSRPAGSSLNGAGQVHSTRSTKRSWRNHSSGAVDPTPLSATDSALERYKNAVEHPGSAGAANAWLHSSRRFEHLPDTPLQLQRPNSILVPTHGQADATLSAVSNDSAQAPIRSPTHRDLFAESQDAPGDDNATYTSSSTQHLGDNLHSFSGTSTPGGRPQVARFSNQNSTHSPLSGSPPASAANDVQKKDLLGDSTTQCSSNPSTPPELQHGHQWSARQQQHHGLSGKEPDPCSTPQWTLPARGEVKPQLISEELIELETRKIADKKPFIELDKTLSAEAEWDPYLFDKLIDMLRQRTVEMWLLRSEIAWMIEDWSLMERHARQAQKLADVPQLKPFIKRSAFLIRIAVNGESVTPEERAQFDTLPTSIVEEGEGYLPKAEFGTLESEVLENIHPRSHEVEASTEAPESLSFSDAREERSSSMQRPTLSDALNTQSLAPSAQHGLAVKLASIPKPASITTPRLYDPANPYAPSPPLPANSPRLRSGLNVPQTHPVSGLSEIVLPDAALPSPRSITNGSRGSASEGEKSSTSGGVPLPTWAVPQTDEPARHNRQPLHPSSLFAKERLRSPDPSLSLEIPSQSGENAPEQKIEP
ncbi:MAG: hypothetical protein Q9216_000527 [Gyalolechia sp. 2 TL-2023]